MVTKRKVLWGYEVTATQPVLRIGVWLVGKKDEQGNMGTHSRMTGNWLLTMDFLTGFLVSC